MFTTAILLAAGSGSRMRSGADKALVNLSGRPVIAYSLKTLSRSPEIRQIIIVVNRNNCSGIMRLVKAGNFAKVCRIIAGGRRRQDSLASGLRVLDKRTRFVLVHDAARPFVGVKIIADCLKEARKSGAAVAGVPVKATIKECASGNLVRRTLNRERLWEIQTPQVFRKELILEAFERFGRKNVTDDANLVEKLGKRVKIVGGTYFNIKITTPEDLVFGRAIAKARK
jgi:2-C-methyl-D-erythritol 4-phosphate cytidylyltransferase